MVEGLWAGYKNASLGDFPTVLKRVRALGFNGLRLPFTFQDLDMTPSTFMYQKGCVVRGKLRLMALGTLRNCRSRGMHACSPARLPGCKLA